MVQQCRGSGLPYLQKNRKIYKIFTAKCRHPFPEKKFLFCLLLVPLDLAGTTVNPLQMAAKQQTVI